MLEQSPQILVLEDDPDLRETMAEILEDEGYRVVAVARGEDAVARASVQNFDLIVSDIRMDGMDGLEAIHQTQRLQPSVGSLVVSGYCSEQETMRAFGLNVGGYLRKPFDVKEFLKSVQEILQRHLLQKRFQAQVERYRQAWRASQRELVLSWEQQAFPGLSGWFELCEKLALQAGQSSELAAAWAWRVARPGAPTPVLQSETTGLLDDLALYLWPYASTDWPAPGELAGKFPQNLIDSYQRALANPRPAEPAEGPGGLLALAQNLEESQSQASMQAYQRLLEVPGEPALQACFGLARIAWRQGERAVCQQRLQQAEALKPRLPREWARGVAEMAVLTRQPELLAQARQWLNQDSQSPELWLVEMADPESTTAAREQAALQLLGPRCQAQLSRHAGRLLPEMLTCLSAAQGGRRLTFLLMDCAHLLHPEQLPESALTTLIGAFENCPQDFPADLLQALLQHRESGVRRQARQLQEGPRTESQGLLRLRSFGVFEAQCGAKKIGESDWRTQKVKFMLAYLASRWDRPVNEDELLELFWPEARGTGKRNLYVAISTLRKILRPQGEALEVDYIVRQTGRLGLNLSLPIWHDASEAESAWMQGQEHHKAGRLDQARECLRQVCELAAGPFLEGCYLDWAVRRRSLWEERLARASLSLAQSALQQGGAQEAATWAERSLEWEPAGLEAHGLRLRAYLAMRQPEAVLRHFEAAESSLRREFGLEPSTEMLEAYHRARHGIFG